MLRGIASFARRAVAAIDCSCDAERAFLASVVSTYDDIADEMETDDARIAVLETAIVRAAQDVAVGVDKTLIISDMMRVLGKEPVGRA